MILSMVGGPRTTCAGGRLGERVRLRSITLFSGWLAPALLAAVLCACLALLLARLEISTDPASLLSRVNDIARTVASALFLTAGVLRLTRWRIHHDGRSAAMGSALVLLGGLCFPLVTVTRLLADQMDDSVVATLTRGLVTVLVIDIVWRALSDHDDEHRNRPLHLIPGRAAVTVAGFVLLVGLSLTGATRLLATLPVHVRRRLRTRDRLDRARPARHAAGSTRTPGRAGSLRSSARWGSPR